MSKCVWDAVGERLYETGDKNGVIYPQSTSGVYQAGEAWNGLTAVSESPSGAEETALWADDMKYLSLRSKEEFGFTIQCYMFPEAFEQCNGIAEIAPGVKIGQQARRSFGFSYQSTIGNDTVGEDYGYKIHLIYGAAASPSERSYATINDSPSAIEFSYECTTIPVAVPGFKPTACLTLDSNDFATTELRPLWNHFLDVIWGKDGSATYTAVTPAPTAFEHGLVYFERSGEEGAYVYTATSDTTPVGTKTYYTNGERTPYLPLPNEVATMLTPE